jgi:hypothetical protein
MCLTRRHEVREFPSKDGRKPYYVRCALPYKNEKRTSPGKVPGTKPLRREEPAQALFVPEKMTGAVVDGLCVVLREHQASRNVQDALKEQVSKYLNLATSEKEWVKKAKYLLTFPRAKYLKNELPPSPEGGAFAPRNPLKGWMKARLNAFNPRNTHLWSSWNEAKRCADCLSEAFIKGVFEEHFQKLSSPDPLEGREELLDVIFENEHFKKMLTDLANCVSNSYDDLRNFRTQVPSQSACFERTRSKGGQCEELKEFAEIPDWCGLAIPELHSMKHYDRLSSRGVIRSYVHSIYRSPFLYSWETEIERFDGTYQIDAEIRAVLEPLKVRVISKGNASAYYNYKALQRVMHTYLRKEPCFRLIGRKLCPTDILEIKDVTKSHWFSVDYSAATDSLSSIYGMRIMREILRYVPDKYRKGAERVLGNHRLWYPTSDGYPVCQGVQKNGQLMGSILSFPILCLANLGLYLSLSPDHHPNKVLINGDDMLYCADLPMWEKHVEKGKEVGLLMSPGKAYYHDTYCNVNSVSFHCHLSESTLPREIPFLNVGLMFGNHKVQGDFSRETVLEPWQEELCARAHSSKEDDEGFVVNFNEILRGCFSDEMKCRILSELIADNSEAVKAETLAFFLFERKEKVL